MISWITRLCAICAMSALLQMIAGKENERRALKTICGLLMLHMTMECAQTLLSELASCTGLSELFALLLK